MSLLELLLYKLGFILLLTFSLFSCFITFKDIKQTQEKEKYVLNHLIRAIVDLIGVEFLVLARVIAIFISSSTLILSLKIFHIIFMTVEKFKELLIITTVVMVIFTIKFLSVDKNTLVEMNKNHYIINHKQWYYIFATLIAIIIFAAL